MNASKSVQWVIACIAVQFLSCWFLVSLGPGIWNATVSKSVKGRVQNPKYPIDLVYFEADGGATVDFNVQFTFVPRGQEPKMGNTFAVFTGVRHDATTCKWLSPEKLQIEVGCSTEIFKQRVVKIPTSDISQEIQVVYLINNVVEE